jgi:hypothetical protein
MTNAENTELIALALRSVDGTSRRLISAAKTVYGTPETGFNEHKTAQYVLEQLSAIGLAVETGIARTGMKAILRGGSAGPTATARCRGRRDCRRNSRPGSPIAQVLRTWSVLLARTTIPPRRGNDRSVTPRCAAALPCPGRPPCCIQRRSS